MIQQLFNQFQQNYLSKNNKSNNTAAKYTTQQLNSQEASTLTTKVQSMKRFITNENSGTFALPSGRSTKVGTKVTNSKH